MRHNICISNTLKVFALMCGISLLISSCDSGGGGGGAKDAALTANNAPQAVDAVAQLTGVIGVTGTVGVIGGGLSKNKASSKPALQRIIEKALLLSQHPVTVFKGPEGQGRQLQRESGSETGECTDGGSYSINASWDGPEEPQDPSEVMNLQGTVSFRSCEEGSESFNGTLSVTLEGPADIPTKATISTSSFDYADAFTTDFFEMRNFRIVLTEIAGSLDDLMGATTTVVGSMAGSVEGEPIDAEMDVEMIFSSTFLGDTISISGRVKAICLGGWVTLATTTPIFTPSNVDCPTRGEIQITSGANTVQAVIEQNSDIVVSLNGTPVETYDDCNDVEGLCAG